MQTNKKVDASLIIGRKRLVLGQMSWDEAKAYQTELTTPLPMDGCIDILKTELHAEVHITGENLCYAPKSSKIWEHAPVTQLKIEATRNKSKCFAVVHECLNNIKNGKCTDPYVIEHIGRKFFADKYAQKTK